MSYGKVFKLLKDNNINNWLDYTKHDFVQKLANDTLNESCFLNYLIQVLNNGLIANMDSSVEKKYTDKAKKLWYR